jgi:LAO/AO transport system kinase
MATRVTSAASGPNIKQMLAGLKAGDRAAVARAITLVESKRADHQKAARALVQELLPRTGKAVRVGITGMPGVGKSTTIDALGTHLTQQGHRVAVLAVDPSSNRTGGSILADKTRMPRLAADPAAFIRPSPSAGTLGGVAAKTREAMLVCEAAGFGAILVETVGIGQSETAVADMTDFFMLLMLPGAGDELQGIKKGVAELADLVAVNKADGDNIKRATAAAAEYRAALRILTPRSPDWTPPVVTYSALTGDGIAKLLCVVTEHRAKLIATGIFARRRSEQQVKWLWAML